MARVLLGMSGGLDSSVAALLLQQLGHEVIGMTIKTYSYDDVAGSNPANDTSCCSLDGINDARSVAMMLGIPHYVTDLTREFGHEIIDYFKDTYLDGKTPNPCVKCNREIKWGAMLKKADALGCEYISTGHYVHLRGEHGRMVLSRSRDILKDQSYALWAVREEHLHRTLFPLSGYTKTEIREIARANNLPVAGKRESYEICFVSDNDYRRFLRDNVPNIEEQAPHGTFVLHGEVVGEHDGVPFYTIGQRKGLGLSIPSHPEPLYVTGLDVLNNIVELGDDEELLTKQLTAHSVNLIKYAALPEGGMRVMAKIRYKDDGAMASVYPIGSDRIRVEFDEDRRAITPGQSVVLYEGDDVVGGAIIE
ncbi:MAG: tRNA 2-thiouridine(34) synthase MnmA [Bacteroidetes bacterium]|nr:tRNA 2-thiouridine(34) synthase MnmA [Bacteroidota bacterium]